METPKDWPMFCNRDGSYGDAEEIRMFDYGDLTEKQWEVLSGMAGSHDAYNYVCAILDGDEDVIAEYEEGFDA